MEGTVIQNVLRSMGWGDGLHVPVANDENKALEEQIAKLLERKAKASKDFHTSSERCNALEQHLKCIKQESIQNQALLTAYKQEIETENHKIRLITIEKEGLNNSRREMKKELEAVEKRTDEKRADLTKAITKLEKLKAEAAWDTEAIVAWEASLKKRDEDNELLKKFSQEDEKKVANLEAKRQNIQMEVIANKKIIETVCADIVNYEAIMVRTGKMMEKSKIERAALVAQWQEAVKNLRQRDQDIHRANKDVENMQDLIIKKREILEEQDAFLQSQKNNNHMTEFEISEVNNLSSRIRRDLNDIIEDSSLLAGEVGAQKRTIIGSSNTLRKEQLRTKSLAQELERKHQQIEATIREIEYLDKNLEQVKNTSMSASERAKKLETMIDDQQKLTHGLIQDIEKQQSALFRTRQVFNDLLEIGRLKQVEINGTDINMSMMERRAKIQYQELVRSKQALVDLSMEAEHLESKLQNMETGLRSMSDNSLQVTKITELEQLLVEHTEINRLLSGQVFKLQNEMRRLIAAISKDNPKRMNLHDKLNELTLMVEGGRKMAISAKLTLQEKQVDENVLRLRVDQLNKAMTKEDKNIYDLQKYRLDLDQAMKSREIEITTNNEILWAKRRNLNEEKSRLKADIAIRDVKVNHLQSRYNVAISLLGTDDSGEPLSVTHFKIKNAQEKYMLQHEGDELETKIKVTEKEIVAMENTLKAVDQTNNRLKNSLTFIDKEGDEAAEMLELERTLTERSGIIRQMKRKYIALQDELKECQDQLNETNTMRVDVEETIEQMHDEIEKMERDEIERKMKIERAERHIKSYTKNITNEKLWKYDRDLRIRQMQEASKTVMNQLVELSTTHIETRPKIDQYMQERDLKLTLPKSNFSSVSSDSVRTMSDTNSTRSVSSGNFQMSAILSHIQLEFETVRPDGHHCRCPQCKNVIRRSTFSGSFGGGTSMGGPYCKCPPCQQKPSKFKVKTLNRKSNK